MAARYVIRAIPGDTSQDWKNGMGYMVAWAYDDTPLGFIERNEWYWKKYFPDFVEFLGHQGKFNYLMQEEFFKVTTVN